MVIYWVVHTCSDLQITSDFSAGTGCMSGYKKKYAGRIESIKRRFEGEISSL